MHHGYNKTRMMAGCGNSGNCPILPPHGPFLALRCIRRFPVGRQSTLRMRQ